MKVLALVAVLVGVAAALPGLRLRRDSSPLRFELPSNASLVLGRINTGFDCAELPYGYYADTSNDCALFHVCLPYIDNNVYITRHFSFMCGEGTMFDQERLVCAFPRRPFPAPRPPPSGGPTNFGAPTSTSWRSRASDEDTGSILDVSSQAPHFIINEHLIYFCSYCIFMSILHIILLLCEIIFECKFMAYD
nr:uncharacterized protein LOC113821610 [Penaeus vannamei]